MDPKLISSLAKLLRDNGDKILSSEFTLTLSGPLLRGLNDSFTLIADQTELYTPQTFQVVKPNNSKSDVFRDLQLVHDFVQKTTLLCITHFPGDDYFEGTIDISKFRSLRRLEVQKVNIKQITGIQPLREQLQHLTCTRSLQSIEDIITYCGGDNSNGFVWNELKSANFSFNNLKVVNTSLEFAQCLQNLNLSHNQLTSVDAVKWLPNLKVLDLSFNRITHIPAFHNEASRRLQILILSNNFIEDLTGISRLDSLNELDLSDNCLLDHSYLLPLSTLLSLRYLNLQGNPLSCHPKHRQATARYLNKNAGSMNFILDAELLSKSEKLLIGAFPNYQSTLSARYSINSRSSGQMTPIRRSQFNTPASSVGSSKSFKLLENNSSDMTASMCERQKKPKVRTVEIEDVKIETNDQNAMSVSTTESTDKTTLEVSTDHLETKKQIDDLREKFGSGWLQRENCHIVQSVLGIKDTESNDINKISSQQLIDDLLGSMMPPPEPVKDTTPTSSYFENGTLSTSTPNKSETEQKDVDTSVMSSETLYESVADKSQEGDTTLYKTVDEDNASNNLENIYQITNEESEISEPEENEFTYIVHQVDHNDELFLAVSDTSIKERDILTRRTKTKWSLKILESCERIKANTIRINFDTMKKDKKERVYTVEEGLCQELEKYLRNILSQRLLSEMNQTLYKCVKCSTQFSRENTYKRANIDIICPECKSRYIVELHETTNSLTKNTTQYEERPVIISSASTSALATSASTVLGAQNAGENYVIEESASHSSIGSAGSLNESSSCSKISNSENSFDSNQSVAGSSTNDRDLDFNFGKNVESDIEILSNPSQSSIEVLDNAYSSRKTSEERRISQIPSLETIEDNNSFGTLSPVSKETSTDLQQNKSEQSNMNEKKTVLGHFNLTESSSSGSVTDSICTAYEQDDKSTPATITPQSLPKSPLNDKEMKKEDSIISSMFGGLFQSTNILMSRSQKTNETSQPCEKFKYSYVDFSEADHRLKLYLYQHIFEDPNEHFKWLVKGKIYNEISGDLFEGLVVMSTTKFYIMEIFAPEKEEISKWLKRAISATVDRIDSIELLPWKIGVTFIIKGIGSYLLLLQDILRTDSLLLYLTNNPLPDTCTIDYQISEKLLKKISYFTNDEQLKMLSILNNCEVTSDIIHKTFSPSGFFATDTHLYLTNSNFSWLSNNFEHNLELGHKQLMSNLVEVDRPSKNEFSINFLDEVQDKCELWKCNFDTEENADSCLNAIGQSWEKLFGVPLSSN